MNQSEIFQELFRINQFCRVGDLLIFHDGTTSSNCIISSINAISLSYITYAFGHYTITIVKSNGESIGTVINKDTFNLFKKIA